MKVLCTKLVNFREHCIRRLYMGNGFPTTFPKPHKHMTQYYECHVTLLGNSSELRTPVERAGWIFSCIENDICLGSGIKCYATMHYSVSKYTVEDVIRLVEDVANSLREQSCNVIRTKVELVVYDSRQAQCRAMLPL